MTTTGARIVNTGYSNINETNLVSSGATGGLDRTYRWEDPTARLDRIRVTDAPAAGAATAYASWTYGYDQVGNVRRVTGTRQDTAGGPEQVGAWCYGYDGLNRLTSAATLTPQTGSTTGCTTTEAPTGVTGVNYRQQFTFNRDRVTQASNTTSAGTATLTYAYPATANTRPHATTGLTRTGTADAATNASLPLPATLAYDPAGRVTTYDPDPGAAITYAYDQAGNLATNGPAGAGGADTHTHAYDPDGLRVARRRGPANTGVTTLFLGELEVTGTATGTATALRTHTTPDGVPIGTQTSTGTPWTWLLADAADTIRLVRPDGTSPTRLHYYPYGAPVTPPQPTTPGNRGFLNKTHDLSGDLRLDARHYTPRLNLLTTPDPLLNPDDPQTLNPYAYARHNPVTLSDPTGLTCDDPNDPLDAGCHRQDNPPADTDTDTDAAPAPPADPSEPTSEESPNDYTSTLLGPVCGSWNAYSCGSTVGLTGPPITAVGVARFAVFDERSCEGEFDIGCAAEVAVAIPFLKPFKLFKFFKYGDEGADAAKPVANACGLKSFSGETLVLMADGTKKPIDQIKVGDQVIATDPETGEQAAKTVTHLWVHGDTLIELVVDGEVITTTEDHPFWSITDQKFKRADQLSRGEKVLGAHGRRIRVSGLKLAIGRPGVAYNLSVQGIHTYHVGASAILVHNTGGGICGLPSPSDAAALIQGAKPTGSALKSDAWHRSAAFAVDDIAANGTVFRTVGGDGVERLLVQLPGEVNGVAGRFEWIVDGGNLTHQMFVRGGTVNGIPIKP